MYLIDGYNVLYQTTLETREELIEKINNYCRHEHKQAVIVFDGYSPEDLSNDIVEVRFVGDADAEIISVLKANDNPTSLTLVSSDKELLYEARRHKVEVIPSEHFNYIIPSAPKADIGEQDIELTEEEAQRELQEFNYFQSNE